VAVRLLHSQVSIRPMLPSDSAAIDQLFAAMSPENRYRRFHAAAAKISATMRRYLLDLDGLRRVAFVAEVPDGGGMRAIGIGRYAAVGCGQAELAVAVADDFHRHGVGSALMERTVSAARAAGYRTLQAEVLPENTAAIGLMRAVFPAVTIRRDGYGLRLTVGPVDCTVGGAA
jgi:GNAT superfamily N-acetyltransferase